MSLFKQAYDALICNDVDEKISLTNKLISYQGLKDMGKVMGILKSQLAGKADFSALSGIVKEMLN